MKELEKEAFEQLEEDERKNRVARIKGALREIRGCQKQIDKFREFIGEIEAGGNPNWPLTTEQNGWTYWNCPTFTVGTSTTSATRIA